MLDLLNLNIVYNFVHLYKFMSFTSCKSWNYSIDDYSSPDHLRTDLQNVRVLNESGFRRISLRIPTLSVANSIRLNLSILVIYFLSFYLHEQNLLSSQMQRFMELCEILHSAKFQTAFQCWILNGICMNISKYMYMWPVSPVFHTEVTDSSFTCLSSTVLQY